MSLVEGGRKLEDFGEKSVTEDLSGLFNEGEIAMQDEKGRVEIVKQAGEYQGSSPELPAKNEAIAGNSNMTQEEVDAFMVEVATEQKMRQLNPKIVSSAWESLNHYEKRFVTSPQSQFDKLIDEYEASHSTKRKNLITGLRKLTESHSPLVAEIKPEPKLEEVKKEEEKEKIAA